MLEFIRIQRFKTLLDAEFELADLNIFSGLNGMGKSSLIQVLLLLRQSFQQGTLFDRGLLLRGEYATLGRGSDILAAQAESDSVIFLLKWLGTEPVPFQFDSTNSELQPIAAPVTLTREEAEGLSLFNRHFQYLSTDRIGPRMSYDISEYSIRDLNSLGNRGEYTAHFIAENGLKPLPISELRHERATTLTLIDNLNQWMSEFSPGLRVHATVQPLMNAVSLSYAFQQGDYVTDDFNPHNVGFGLTFVLPVITAILRSSPGDLLIIENPESHLHPAGQAMLGRLCAMAANGGVQLILETHSDHFLNGVRVAVREGVIGPEGVRLFFLERHDFDSFHASLVQCPEIDEEGRVDHWPDGFFDEWGKQLERLL
ncbi:MAG: Predicted ATPase [Candidatus Kentron sp. G]|nr:MAG: Predicted ATPase [Candidatus Kentron sp. G]VFN01246.1 MAG: Predicted ATPase [Candidatus Kentron sp. G]VFN02890.1 MAG: Predicted ATPase [Candidatus Kentron sp. G]